MATVTRIVQTPGVAGGQPRIAGTRIRVMDIVGTMRANGWSAATYAEHFPQLALDDVLAALEFYVHHAASIEAAFEAEKAAANQLKAELGPEAIDLRNG